jgi:hypothetical protein
MLQNLLSINKENLDLFETKNEVSTRVAKTMIMQVRKLNYIIESIY